jgi:hypothetical protein
MGGNFFDVITVTSEGVTSEGIASITLRFSICVSPDFNDGFRREAFGGHTLAARAAVTEVRDWPTEINLSRGFRPKTWRAPCAKSAISAISPILARSRGAGRVESEVNYAEGVESFSPGLVRGTSASPGYIRALHALSKPIAVLPLPRATWKREGKNSLGPPWTPLHLRPLPQ